MSILALAALGSYFEIFNYAYKAITHLLSLNVYRPQDGPLVAGSLIVLSFWACLALGRVKWTPFRVGAVVISHSAYLFWIIVHVAMIFPIIDGLSQRHIERLNAEVMSPGFAQACKSRHVDVGDVMDPEISMWTCAEGSSVDELPEWLSGIAGVSGIHRYALDTDELISKTWLANWEGKRNIDVPLKYVTYLESQGRYRVIVDWSQYQIDKSLAIRISSYFLLIFSLVWVMAGSALLQFHDKRIRGRG